MLRDRSPASPVDVSWCISGALARESASLFIETGSQSWSNPIPKRLLPFRREHSLIIRRIGYIKNEA